MTLWEPIPGETPIDDASGLLVKGITLRSQLNVVELENIGEALLKYLIGTPTKEMAPFDLSWALELHREMFGKVWAWAGTPRNVNLNIGVPVIHVETELYQLLGNIHVWSMPLIEQSAMLHYGAVRVHPFLNGNGRSAHLLANIWLKQHDHPITEWPEGAIGESSPIRHEYIAAIKSADQHDYSPIIRLHEQYTTRTG